MVLRPMPFRTPTTILPQRSRKERRSKVYSVAEYRMMLQEAETVRLNRQAHKAHQQQEE